MHTTQLPHALIRTCAINSLWLNKVVFSQFVYRMALQVRRRDLSFPGPMGNLSIHVFQELYPKADSFKGLQVSLSEVVRVIFGPTSFMPLPVNTSMLSKRLKDGNICQHWKLCTDRPLMYCLSTHGIIPSARAASTIILSLPCLVALMRDVGCPQSMMQPVEHLNSHKHFIMVETPSPTFPNPSPAPPLSPSQSPPAPPASTEPPSSAAVLAAHAAVAEAKALAAEARVEAAAAAAAAIAAAAAGTPPPTATPPFQAGQPRYSSALPHAHPHNPSLPAKPLPPPESTLPLPPPPHSPSCPDTRIKRSTSLPSPTQLFSHVQPTTPTSFPMKLPPASIWGSAMGIVNKRRFGLTILTCPPKFLGELNTLKAIVMDPQPNLHRTGVCGTQLQEESWRRHEGSILR